MKATSLRARAAATLRNMMRSLRIRLLLLLGVAIGAAAFLQFIASFSAAMQEANKLFDYHMQQMAYALQDSGFETAGWHGMAGAGNEDFEFVVQIWTDDGVRVYQSRTYRALPERGPLGYSNVNLPNGDWRVYAVQASTRVIQVSQRIESRRSRAMALALRALWPVLAVSLLLFGAAWWVVTTALAPLNRIGHDLANRNADSLAPVSVKGVPHEVSLLVAELNSLLVRVAGALQSQQRFVADAAHELRSPLTALRLQVQTLARARDDAARQQAVTRLLGGVDRATRLVEQLLVLARQDPAVPNASERVTLAACVLQATADVGPLANARKVCLEYPEDNDIEVLGDPDSLRIMVRNLLDNAVRYTPAGGRVKVEIGSGNGSGIAAGGDGDGDGNGDPQRVHLCVHDSGPGIAAADRARIFDRFYRVPGTREAGSGLGLAIVKAIAERHEAAITLGLSPLGGLAATVSFPLPPGPVASGPDATAGASSVATSAATPVAASEAADAAETAIAEAARRARRAGLR